MSELGKTPDTPETPDTPDQEDSEDQADKPAGGPPTNGRIALWVVAGLVALYLVFQGLYGILSDDEPAAPNSQVAVTTPASWTV